MYELICLLIRICDFDIELNFVRLVSEVFYDFLRKDSLMKQKVILQV